MNINLTSTKSPLHVCLNSLKVLNKSNTSKAFKASGAIINYAFRQKPIRSKPEPQIAVRREHF